MPEFREREAARAEKKARELAPYVAAAFERKEKLKPLADEDIPTYPAYGLTVAPGGSRHPARGQSPARARLPEDARDHGALMKAVRIYTGADKKSHFEDLDIPLKPSTYGTLSDLVPSDGVIFRETPAGGALDFHVAPAPPVRHHPGRARRGGVRRRHQATLRARRHHAGRRHHRAGPHHAGDRGAAEEPLHSAAREPRRQAWKL